MTKTKVTKTNTQQQFMLDNEYELSQYPTRLMTNLALAAKVNITIDFDSKMPNYFKMVWFRPTSQQYSYTNEELYIAYAATTQEDLDAMDELENAIEFLNKFK